MGPTMIRTFLIVFLLATPGAKAATYRDGKSLWQSKCVQCHTKWETAPKFASFYASMQWNRYFIRDKHKAPLLSQTSTEEERAEILNYLKANAADSDHPEVAGIQLTADR